MSNQKERAALTAKLLIFRRMVRVDFKDRAIPVTVVQRWLKDLESIFFNKGK